MEGFRKRKGLFHSAEIAHPVVQPLGADFTANIELVIIHVFGKAGFVLVQRVPGDFVGTVGERAVNHMAYHVLWRQVKVYRNMAFTVSKTRR